MLEISPVALLVAAGILGLVVGSFLNVVAYRLPIMMELAWRQQCAELQADAAAPALPPQADQRTFSLWWPPSTCRSCGQRVAVWHNIPVLSYVLLRGRCASCGAGISRRYPVVEAAAAVTALVVAYVMGSTWQLLPALFFTWALLALSVIDIDHKLLPDSVTLPLMWAGLLLSLVAVNGMPLFVDTQSAVIGAAAGYLSLWSVYHLFKLLTGREGMGYGDFKLLAALGAWLGWQMLPLVILLSAAVGAVVGSVMIVAQGRSRHTPMPFGPYLAGAGWIALLWGVDIVEWYLGLYGR